VDIEYENWIVKKGCEMVAGYKDNHAMRYKTLASVLEGGVSQIMIKGQIERKLNMLTPIYLIKKAFTLKKSC